MLQSCNKVRAWSSWLWRLLHTQKVPSSILGARNLNALIVQWLEYLVANEVARVQFPVSARIRNKFCTSFFLVLLSLYYVCIKYCVHDWRSWQRVGLIILRSWVRSPHRALHSSRTIGAVGSALVLCTEGPGFEPLMVQKKYVTSSSLV